MASWPSTLPAPQKSISITPGDTRKERKLQSGRTEFRRFGDGKPDQAKVLFRLTWAEWDIFKEFYAHDLNLGINWFSADWLVDLGYDAYKAKILGYPREVALQSYYVDVLCNLIIQKTAWIVGIDTEWPCEATGGEPPILEGFGYIYGGQSSSTTLQDCEEYGTEANTWTSKSDMLLSKRNLAASTIGSSGYVYGGTAPASQDCDQYTPDTWTSKSDIPAPARQLLAASTIGSSGYIYGGSGYLQDCDQYTPDTWTSKSDMPSPGRFGLAASTIANSGYVYGGYSPALQDCDQYTPDTWTSKSNMPSPGRFYLAASTIGSSGYIYGGSGYLQDCDQYTPDTWTSKSDMPSPGRHSLAASTIAGGGYIYGGYTGSSYLQDCDKYVSETWIYKSDILAPGRRLLAASTI